MKRVLLLFAIAALSTASMAQTMSKDEIIHGVQTFAAQMRHTPQPMLKQVCLPEFGKLCVFNIEGGGFVIASSDSRTRPILGYSPDGAVNPADMPDNLRWWLTEYESQIAQLGSTTIENLHQAYKETSSTSSKDALPEAVAPMLLTAWNQYGNGYNSLTPYDEVLASDSSVAIFDGHVTVGCGALAMAQIMRYWEFPTRGQGHHSYTQAGENPCWRYGTLYADFANTTYDYGNMPYQLTDSSTTAQINAVATLAYHCGVACNMSYNNDCHGSSGAMIEACMSGMQHFFHYSDDVAIEMKQYYYDNDWINLLKQDLAAGHPVFYCGQSYDNPNEGTILGAHAFVFDGYDSNDFFHVNWGWGGSCDGYYSVSVLRPLTQYDFTTFQYCALNIHPCYEPMPILTMGADLVLDTSVIGLCTPVSGSYSITNIGDTAGTIFFGVNIYTNDPDRQSLYAGCVDGCRFTLQPGDTVSHTFSHNLNLPAGEYLALMQYSTDSFYAGIPTDMTHYHADLNQVFQVPFTVRDLANRRPSNLVLFAHFHDDRTININFFNLEPLFNSEIANHINPLFYGAIGFNHTFANQVNYDDHSGNVMPFIDPNPRGYYELYDSYAFPDGDTMPYPQCGPSAREMEFLSHLSSYINNRHLVAADANLDNDNDGEIDHVSIFLIGDNMWMSYHGMMSDHNSRYSDDAPPLTINGKRVGNYSIYNGECFSINNDVGTAKLTALLCHALGLPDLEHHDHHLDVHPTVDKNVLSLGGYQAPSAIFKYKYLGLCDPPVQITTDGRYVVKNSDQYNSENLYYIKSSIDSNQWYLIEYRRFLDIDYCERNNGLYISRWMDTMPIDPCYGGNAHADFYTRPNAYWTFRPGSSIDTVNGRGQAFFSAASGRTSFGPDTDPHPYLADGTPERSFEIYNIVEHGASCAFSVRFLAPDTTAADTTGIANPQVQPAAQPYVAPNPATRFVAIANIPAGTPVEIYDMKGIRITSTICQPDSPIDLSALPAGIYMLSTPNAKLKLIKQ